MSSTHLTFFGMLRNDAKMQCKINDSEAPKKLLHACEQWCWAVKVRLQQVFASGVLFPESL